MIARTEKVVQFATFALYRQRTHNLVEKSRNGRLVAVERVYTGQCVVPRQEEHAPKTFNFDTFAEGNDTRRTAIC